ncbi:hypothetical protein KR074_001581 [Drosophila pseudoananassae]|nr:hypothetical protein KR074_001581 [Drosophila pseudoananassae]
MEEMCKPPAVSSSEESKQQPQQSHHSQPSQQPTVSNGKGVHFKLLPSIHQSEPEEELLGSVTMHNCPGTRASARVIQKMKQDQTRPMTPPPSERELSKKEEKAAQKTPSQLKTGNGKTTWTNIERNCFFDALNEFGKDFEAVANCINAKLKRRNANSDYSFKTKDHVRQHYYQTYHKICKYVRYSEELKKPAQELYTLINYGEMRRKLTFLTEKHFMKMKQLVYQGQIMVRSKGKNIRIKTPSCKALRRLNQLDDSLEDIRLPSKVEVVVTPANMESFGRVQSLAQNPRGRIIVPLHKKLISFIKTFEFKWRSESQRLSEEKSAYMTSVAAATTSSAAATSTPTTATTSSTATTTTNSSGTIASPAVAASTNNNNNETEPNTPAPSLDPLLCFQPRPGVTIHRPLLSITAYLSSVNICLTAYEERMGFKVRSESLANVPCVPVATSKRPRTESGSEKRSPEAKKPKSGASPALEKSLDEGGGGGGVGVAVAEENHAKVESSSGDELGEEILEFLAGAEGAVAATPETTEATETAPATPATTAPAVAPPPPPPAPPAPPAPVTPAVTPTVSRAKRKEAKEAAAAAQARNFKPLLSDDILKRIRRGWTVSNAADITIGDLYVVLGQDSKLELEYYWCEIETTSVPAVPSSTACSNSNTSTTSSPATSLLPYNPNDCDSVERVKAVTSSTVSNRLKHLLMVANLSERVRRRQCTCGHTCDRKRDLMSKAQQLAEAAAAAGVNSGMDGNFRTPMLPVRRPIGNIIDPVRQLTALTRQKLRRQVLVQRRLLPPGSLGARPYDMLSVRQLHSGLFQPIDRLDADTASSGIGSSVSSSPSLSVSSVSNTSQCQAGRLSLQDNQEKEEEPAVQLMEALPLSETLQGGRDMPNLDFCGTTTTTISADSSQIPEPVVQDESTTQNFFHGSVSPMHLLRDSTSNARWLEDNINDFSLTSLLGHLDEIDATRDILDPSSSMSVISESSVDFRHKFQEIAALLQQQEKD